MEVLLSSWFLFSVLVGIVASVKGRSGLAWFLVSVITSPVIAGIFVLVVRSRNQNNTSGYGTVDLSAEIRNAEIRSRFAPFVTRYKPPMSNTWGFRVDIAGERRNFRTEGEAIAFAASRSHLVQGLAPALSALPHSGTQGLLELAPAAASQGSTPMDGNQASGEIVDQGTFDGVRYTLHSDGRVVGKVGTKIFTWESVDEFRNWIRLYPK